jgi:hypothetical protein
MTACCHHDLHEERFSKAMFSNRYNSLNVRATTPSNLQVIPYSPTEIALEKQVCSIFMSSKRTQHNVYPPSLANALFAIGHVY